MLDLLAFRAQVSGQPLGKVLELTDLNDLVALVAAEQSAEGADFNLVRARGR